MIATVGGAPLRYREIHPEVVQIFWAVRSHGAGPRTRAEVAELLDGSA